MMLRAKTASDHVLNDDPQGAAGDLLLTLATRLRARLAPGQVITDVTQLRTYECDGITGYRVVPGIVTLPESTEEVAFVVAENWTRRVLRRFGRRLCWQTVTGMTSASTKRLPGFAKSAVRLRLTRQCSTVHHSGGSSLPTTRARPTLPTIRGA